MQTAVASHVQKADPVGVPTFCLGCIRINNLLRYRLRLPLDVIIEVDGSGYIARSVDLVLYGYAEDPIEALNILKKEIESLYDDLTGDDQFTADWLQIKAFLLTVIEK